MNKNYEEEAKQFLSDTKTTLEVVEAVPQKSPLWADEGEHGINYSVTLKNSKHTYVFDFWGSIADKQKIELAQRAKERGVYSSEYFAIKDFCAEQAKETVPNVIKGKKVPIGNYPSFVGSSWLKNVVDTVKILIKPTCYDILSALNVLSEDTFKDFCDSYGYNIDSISALKTFELCKEQDRQLHKLFTHDELEKLSEIQ